MSDETKVTVSEKLIREGIAGSCHRCPVVMAIIEAVGDSSCEPMVVERDWSFRLCVWGRYLLAPCEVRQFVYALDSLGRKKNGAAKLPRKLTGDLAPFTFTLPSITDPEWEEACYGCEELFDPSDLDGEGMCPECLEKERSMDAEEGATP